jgi:hypothetical protein
MRQLPMTSACVSMDHRSQGQTIECIIIEIGLSPSTGLSPFNAYTALFRSRGRRSTRLLRDFDSELFTKYPSEMLQLEDIKLRKIDMKAIVVDDIGDDVL